MTTRFFPHIANRLAELTHMSSDAMILCAETDDVATLTALPILLPDIIVALRAWRRVLRPGRAVAFSRLGANAFRPLASLYEARIRSYGVKPAALTRHFPNGQLADPETCRDLLHEAGFEEIEVRIEQLGYDLCSADEWWDIVWHSSLRGSASQLSPDQLATFKAEHLAEVSALASSNGNGIWLDVPAIFAVGRVVNFEAPE